MKTIEVKQEGNGYWAYKFFYKDNKVTGIAEWDEIACEHESPKYSIIGWNKDELEVECACDLSAEEEKMLLNRFNWDAYYA